MRFKRETPADPTPETPEVIEEVVPEVAEEATPETLDRQVYIGEPGAYALVTLPDGIDSRERRITINGKNYEHVDDDPTNGVWRYRAM